MDKLKIVIALFFCINANNIQAIFKQDPLLVCALMIKNEAQVIENTLKPLIDGGIDSFLIFDTESTDNTIETVVKLFNSYSLTNYIIRQEKFIDFSTSRNRALDLVKEYFPQSTFILMPDAEWILHNASELLKFCKLHKNDPHAGYLIHITQNDILEFDATRLIRTDSNARFKFPVHEYLECHSRSRIPKDIYFEYNPSSYGTEKSSKRYERDVNLLLKTFSENPQDPRASFYLAQTYECLGDYQNAYRFYELRTHLKGWDEENFMAMYKLAQIVEQLAKLDPEKKTIYDWALAQYYYLKAYSMRPSRIEPLISIASHYLAEEQHGPAYLFASVACKVPFPQHDILFIDKEIYSYVRYNILGQSAWYVGEYDIGEWAVKKALEKNKHKAHLNFNLELYLDRKYQLGSWKVESLDLEKDNNCFENNSKEWSILICTLPERKSTFEQLTAKLKHQIKDAGLEYNIEILYFSDNHEFPIGFKRNKLLQKSRGTYVNFIDDDDDIHDNYISMIYEKLQLNPDCVSLVGIITQDGKNPKKFIHSLKYDHYFESKGIYYRPPNHLNPIKREIAQLHKFPLTSWKEDYAWAAEIAQSQQLNYEEELREPYYFYNYVTKK